MITPIYIIYPFSDKISGQQFASEQIISHFKTDRRFDFKPVKIKALERSGKNLLSAFTKYIFYTLSVWFSFLRILFSPSGLICFNTGLTLNALVRTGLPYLSLIYLRKGHKSVISLHGACFLAWRKQDVKYKLLFHILKRTTLITVLGEKTQEFLLKNGISEEKIYIVPNSCGFKPLTEKLIKAKHLLSANGINVTFLSNLIKSKGYIEYLDALIRLSENSALKINIKAVLCGELMQSNYSKQNIPDLEAIVKNKIKTINNSAEISIKWVKGLYGEDKEKLFKESHIFVFPSRIEAQPVVLMEAMAAGCAVISTKAGEIPFMFSDGNAILLDNMLSENISGNILKLAEDNELRTTMAVNALNKYQAEFSTEVYYENWNHIFGILAI